MNIEPGIDNHGNGFRARIMIDGERVSKVFPTLELARRFRDGTLSLVAAGEIVVADGVTVAQAGRPWLKTRAHLSSHANDRSRWELHVAPSALGRTPVVAVTRKMVKAFARSLKGATASRRNVMTLVRGFFASYCEDEEIPNPAADVHTPSDDAASKAHDEYLTLDEQNALIAGIAGPEKWIVAFALGTGVRQGEQWNLHIRDVDLVNRRVTIRYGGFRKGKLRTPKNGKSRVVELFGIGLLAAREWLAALPSYAKANPLGLMFPTERGSRRQQSKVPQTFLDARDVVARVHVRWHTLRHACASALVAGWWGQPWRLEAVSKHLGHQSMSVTERYAHLAGSALTELAARMPDWSTSGPLGALAPVENGSHLGDLKTSLVAEPPSNPTHLDHLGTSAVRALEAVASGHPHAVRMLLEVVAAVVPNADARPARARLRLVSGAS